MFCSKNNAKDFDEDEAQYQRGPTLIIVSQNELTGKANITFTGKKNETLHVVIGLNDDKGVRKKEIILDAKCVDCIKEKELVIEAPRAASKSPRSPKSPRTSTFPEDTERQVVKTRDLIKPKKDVVITVGSGKIHHSHELMGNDDGFVKVVIGDVEKKTSVVDNSQDPVWNENLYFEGVNEEDIANAEVSVLDYDILGPACPIGNTTISLTEYVDKKARLKFPLFRDGKEEAVLEVDAVVLPVGGAARERAKAEKAEAERLASMDAAERAAEEKKAEDKAAAQQAKLDKAAAEKAAKEAAKEAEREAKEAAKEAERAAKEKAKNDKAEAEREALERKKAERAAKEKAKADAEKAKIEAAQAAREWELNRPKKDAVITVGSGKIYHSHELAGDDDGFVKVVIGDVEQKTSVIDNSQEPVWNENLYFESIYEEDFARATVSVLDYDILGPACPIGSATLSLSEYVDKKAHLKFPLFRDGKEEAMLEMDVVLLECGNAARIRTATEAAAKEKAARDKAEAEKAKADAKAAEAAAKEKAKADKQAEKEAAEKAKADAKAAEKAAAEKAKADKAAEKAAAEKAKADAKAAEQAAKDKAKADKQAEKEAAEKAKADAKAAEQAAKEKAKADKQAEKDAAEKAKADAKAAEQAAVVEREFKISAKGNKKATIMVVRGEVIKKGDILGKGDPFVKIEIGKESQQTQSCKGSLRPQWNWDMVFEHVNDTNAENMVVSVLDENTATKSSLIGTTTLSLVSYLDNKKHITINVLDASKGKTVVARLELDVLLEVEGAPSKRPAEGEKRGVINVKSGRVFEKHDTMGKGDPFLKIVIGCAEQKTSVKNNTQDPVWNEKLYFENISEEDAGNVYITIWDHDATSDDKFGSAVFSLVPFKGKKGPISVVLYDEKKKEQAKVEFEVALEVEKP